MNLHKDKEAFNYLCILAADCKWIPVSAAKRDYYIAMMLQKLSFSKYASNTVFKVGTSLSKCFPDSIRSV